MANPIETGVSLAFGMPGGWEWIVIALIALLIFGRRLPEVARSLGDGIREFKKGVKDTVPDLSDDASRPNQYAQPRAMPEADSRTVAQGAPVDPESTASPSSPASDREASDAASRKE